MTVTPWGDTRAVPVKTTERARGGGRYRPNRERDLSAGRLRPNVVGRPAERPPRSEGWSRPWQPLAGRALLDRLRTTGRARPAVDPGFAAGLRSSIEGGIASIDGACAATGGDSVRRPALVPAEPLVVTRERLARALCCPAHDFAPRSGKFEPSIALGCGALVSVLFRQQVTVGIIGDPMTDGLAALSLDPRQAALVEWIESLTGPARAELAAEVDRQAEALVRRWPALEASWLPRTNESMRASFAGGAVVLSARVDLVIGRPAEREASVAVVELVSGSRRPHHRADRYFAALLETLRHSAPPFVVATYYTSNGELDVEAITEDLLTTAARRVVAGVDALVARAERSDNTAGPAAFCSWCSVFPWDAGGAGFTLDAAGAGSGRLGDRPPGRNEP
ncbi:MAG: hypothetical protein WB565_01700 [Acidimicrobiales bacterium]